MAEKLTLKRHESPAGTAWEFVHPRCARRRRADMEEVEAMVEAGETEIARDELVWLLSECPDFLDAHVHLGLIALEEEDPKLARGHFGRAYELCMRALETAGNPQPLPYSLDGNRPFYEAAKDSSTACSTWAARRWPRMSVAGLPLSIRPIRWRSNGLWSIAHDETRRRFCVSLHRARGHRWRRQVVAGGAAHCLASRLRPHRDDLP